MKAISEPRREWLRRRVRLLWKSSVRLANYSKSPRRGRSGRLQCCVILVPKYLIGEKHEQRTRILGVIKQIETSLARGHCRVKLDFSKVEKIFPGGMLILLAALQRLTNEYPRLITARCPPRSLSSQLLNHFGLAQALALNSALSKPSATSVVGWRFLSGTQADGGPITDLLNQYRSQTHADIPEGLFGALTEGLINVRQHAYSGESEVPELFRKWWLFARIDEPTKVNDGYLYVAIYDMGFGIPATLRRKLKKREIVWDILDKAGQVTNLATGERLDKHLLEAAVEHKRSQTGAPHRGNGLPEMREFVQTTLGGRLHVVSGKAQYTYINGKTDGQTDGFREEFPGTLLLWGLPLRAKEIA